MLSAARPLRSLAPPSKLLHKGVLAEFYDFVRGSEHLLSQKITPSLREGGAAETLKFLTKLVFLWVLVSEMVVILVRLYCRRG